MKILAHVAEEAAGLAVGGRLSCLTFVAFGIGQATHLPEYVSDVEQVVHEESSLQPRDSALGETAGLAAGGALDGQALTALVL